MYLCEKQIFLIWARPQKHQRRKFNKVVVTKLYSMSFWSKYLVSFFIVFILRYQKLKKWNVCKKKLDLKALRMRNASFRTQHPNLSQAFNILLRCIWPMFAKSFQLSSCMLWEYEYWVRCFMQRLVRKERAMIT